MPFEFNWHDPEHTIIRVDTFGETTWDEFTKTVDRIVDELSKTDHRLDLVFNNQTSIPKGNPLPHIRAANRRMSAYDDRFGLLITVGPRSISSVIKVMVDIMMRVYKLERTHLGRDVITMEEALHQISKSRAKDKVTAKTN
ncbi:MAG: hypothetical protein ABI970_17345 [Chloroflexota bacterium]